MAVGKRPAVVKQTSNSSPPSEGKCSQRLPAQQKQQMREVIQHQLLSVAQVTYSGTDTHIEFTYVYV